MVRLANIYRTLLESTIKKRNINESKSVGSVYHFTDFNGLEGILDENLIRYSTVNRLDIEGVSTTRDKNLFNSRFKAGDFRKPFSGNSIRITLDGNLLSNRYQVKPHYDATTAREKEVWGDEKEELWYGDAIIRDGGIKNVKKYIKDISITKFGLKMLNELFILNSFAEYLDAEDLYSSFLGGDEGYKAVLYGIYLRDKFGITNFSGVQ